MSESLTLSQSVNAKNNCIYPRIFMQPDSPLQNSELPNKTSEYNKLTDGHQGICKSYLWSAE